MATFQKLRTMLAVRDLPETIEFYERVLGYQCAARVSDDEGRAVWAHLDRDAVSLMFTWDPPHDHGPGEEHSHDPALNGSLYFTVDDCDEVYREVKAANGEVIWEPTDQEYGMRDFGMHDPNGFLLIFGTPKR